MNLNRRKFLQNFFLSAALLLLTVDVFADSGELPEYCSLQGGLTANGVELLRTSGNPDLDEAAKRIVKMSAPFAELPAELLQEVNVLVITRVWKFSDETGMTSH